MNEPIALNVITDGHRAYTIDAIALLIGCDPKDVDPNHLEDLPPHLEQTYRQRISEAQAHTGEPNDMDALLTYWAQKDHNAITYTDENGTLCMLQTPPATDRPVTGS
jgi:hypothetical protein